MGKEDKQWKLVNSGVRAGILMSIAAAAVKLTGKVVKESGKVVLETSKFILLKKK